ncbi:MAG: GTP-dependent dephospho-CoA kinase family protein [Thermoplasmatota archaeon]
MGRPLSDLDLPEALRAELAAPFGPVLSTKQLRDALQPDDVILSVGDVVSMTLHELGIQPKLFVCDYKTQRGDDSEDYRRVLGHWGDHEIQVANPAAKLTVAAWDAVARALEAKGTTRIVVEGEEDLLGLPCIALAPECAVMLYGMPNQGVVHCRVTTTLKAQVHDLLSRMADPSA